MNFLQILSLMGAAMPLVANFQVYKEAKTAKARKAALKEMTVLIMGLIDDFTALRITNRKKFELHVKGLLETLDIEEGK